MRFTKMQGLGNDFVVVDDRDAAPVDWPGTARALCHRRRGVGADGILLIQRSAAADLRMRLFNADGSEAEMCGNGVRCCALLARRLGLADAVTWETGAGPVRTEVLDELTVRVDMGPPRFAAAEVPVDVAGDAVPGGSRGAGSDGSGAGHDGSGGAPAGSGGTPAGSGGTARRRSRPVRLELEAGGRRVEAAAIGMGNPHCVVRVDDVDDVVVDALGPPLRGHSRFPEGANVEFVQVLSRTRIRQRTFERGVGETDACGTGACASMVALRCAGLVDTAVDVELRGGTLRIEWPDRGPVLMTGPAELVFEGEVEVPAAVLATP